MQGNSVLVGLIGKGKAGERGVGWGRGGCRDAVLVHVRDDGVELRKDGEDDGCRTSRHVVENAGSQRSKDNHDDWWYHCSKQESNQYEGLPLHVSLGSPQHGMIERHTAYFLGPHILSTMRRL